MAVDTQKFLALPPAKTGGDLVPNLKPKGSLDKRKGGNLLSIKVKIVKAADILKGTLAVKKKSIDDERKRQDLLRRKKKEEEIEKPKGSDDGDAKKLGIKLPAFGWLDTIKNFIFNILFGWAALRLLEFLPQLVKLLRPLGEIVKFFAKFGALMIQGFITFVDWGYKAYDWTRGKIGDLFGEGGVKVFDRITGVMKTVLNLQLTLTLALIALSKDFGSNIFDFIGIIRQIFKHGLRRAGPRLLIRIFGKKTAASILGKSVVTKTVTATTAGTVTGTGVGAGVGTGTGTGGTVAATGGVGAAGVAAIVLGVLGLASAIGEGGGQLTEKGKKWNKGLKKNYVNNKDKKWWDPRKWGSWALWRLGGFANRLFGGFFGLLDILGAPFRMIIEAIRWPFMNAVQRDKAALNLEKYDARIREQLRRFVNMFDFLGVVSDKEGGWGALDWHSGESGTDAMGYTGEGKYERNFPIGGKTTVNTETLEKNASYENSNETSTSIIIQSSGSSGSNFTGGSLPTTSGGESSSGGDGDSTLLDLQYKNSG